VFYEKIKIFQYIMEIKIFGIVHASLDNKEIFV